MNLLHHPRLVQCLDAFQGPSELVMVMEYVAGGELFERIVDDDFEHTEPSSAQYVQQILEGLQFMHGQAVVHLDLKPENIVCVSPGSHWIKIIDFGLARKLGEQEGVLHGTPEFMAPEVVAFEPVSFSTDMWSVGVICYILLSGESPFQGDTDMETLSNVTAARWGFEEETFSEISQQAKDFISQLLQKDPRRRPPSAGALLHPWLQQPQPGSPRALPKDRIRQFLARRKWQVPAAAAGMWGCLRLREGLSAHSLPPENRESPAGPQEADPAVPEPGGEGSRGSGGGRRGPTVAFLLQGSSSLWGSLWCRARPALCDPELIPTLPPAQGRGWTQPPPHHSLCPPPAGREKEQPQQGPEPLELLTDQEEEEEDGGSTAASGQ
uniref:Protein kinase domain-containing protein n=1 Tax=Ficedula albicollis TaxID=59894 RepID=U3K403_FICAL